MWILVDNAGRHIHGILDSRNKGHLSLYFFRIPRVQRARAKYITIDIREPYKDVAATYLPNAIVAVDPFHVTRASDKRLRTSADGLMNQRGYGSNAYYLLKKWH